MQKIAIQVVMAAALGLSALSGIAQAAEPFDGKKFFDELSSRGIKAPAGFDGKKFFEEQQARGYGEKNKLDGKAFFDELSSRGVKFPEGFDGKKFWADQQRQGGYNVPPMVDATH